MSGINILIVGERLTFSNQIDRVAEEVFDTADLIWAETLQDIPSDRKFKLVLIEQDLLVPMNEAQIATLAALPAQRIALAYRDSSAATAFLGHVQQLDQAQRFGVIPLNIQYDGWVALLRLLIMGQLYVPLRLLQNRIETPVASMPDEFDLTSRERQILERAAAGKQNKMIAAELNLSEHTVRLYMHRVLGKLGVSNRTEAAGLFFSRHPERVGHP